MKQSDITRRNISAIMKQKRVSGTYVGLAIGLDRTSISKYLHAKREISIDQLAGIAKALNVKVETLLKR